MLENTLSKNTCRVLTDYKDILVIYTFWREKVETLDTMNLSNVHLCLNMLSNELYIESESLLMLMTSIFKDLLKLVEHPEYGCDD